MKKRSTIRKSIMKVKSIMRKSIKAVRKKLKRAINSICQKSTEKQKAKECEAAKKMDKQIKKVKKDIKRDDKKKGLIDVRTLLKMDKKFDRKIEDAKEMKKKCK
jgi:uncharacterized membrane protein YdfJ with MMPL/SSD domain